MDLENVKEDSPFLSILVTPHDIQLMNHLLGVAVQHNSYVVSVVAVHQAIQDFHRDCQWAWNTPSVHSPLLLTPGKREPHYCTMAIKVSGMVAHMSPYEVLNIPI